MAEVKVYNTEGQVVRTLDLRDEVFNQDARPDLAHRVVQWQLNKRRAGTASTKTRSDISGSTRKLFRQKGTGRARKGSIKSPLLRGGGTMFGPLPRSYEQSLPKKLRRKALASALSDKIREGEFLVLEGLSLEAPKTKEVANMLSNLSLPQSGILFVTGNSEEVYDFLRKSANNLDKTKTLKAIGVNVYDILNSKAMVVTVDGLAEIDGRFPKEVQA